MNPIRTRLVYTLIIPIPLFALKTLTKSLFVFLSAFAATMFGCFWFLANRKQQKKFHSPAASLSSARFSAIVDWSELPSDLYDPIFNYLDFHDFVRVGAVCRSWRSACRRALKLPKSPWLLLSTPNHPQSRYIQSPTDLNLNLNLNQNQNRYQVRNPYEIHLPQIAGQHFIGSSQGFLISVDESAQLHAINPLTGAHLPLPPTATVPGTSGKMSYYMNWVQNYLPLNLRVHLMRYNFFVKAVVLAPSPPHDNNYTTVITYCASGGFYGDLKDLAFARSGDTVWTALNSPLITSFHDAIFHKGRLHAVDSMGTLAIFDLDNPSAGPILSPQGPLEYLDQGYMSRFLVESPDRDGLFLVVRVLDDAPLVVKMFKVFKLNKVNSEWDETKSIGDVAMFVGFNHSVSFSARDFPRLQKNSIYFTYGFRALEDSGVFSLEDGSIKLFTLGPRRPPSIWYTPVMS